MEKEISEMRFLFSFVIITIYCKYKYQNEDLNIGVPRETKRRKYQDNVSRET